ncbi:hypothetical protein [Algoriphagus jejuensis]|uniref:hypothetical protein n=1 Tax=Algoriphagus jejuensis TaxID=419934 RepID=UPI003CD0AA62
MRFEERQIDWQAAYATYRPMVNSSTTDAALFDTLSEILGTYDDGRVSLTAPDINNLVV